MRDIWVDKHTGETVMQDLKFSTQKEGNFTILTVSAKISSEYVLKVFTVGILQKLLEEMNE